MSEFKYPKEFISKDPINARLGIKSSFPNAKQNLALLYLLWVLNGKKAKYEFYDQDQDRIKIKKEYLNNIFDKVEPYLQKRNTKDTENKTLFELFEKEINSMGLVTDQIESLQVAFELVWCLAKVTFVNKEFSNVKERKGGKRYTKCLEFTSNMDLINYAFLGQEDELNIALTTWIFEKSKVIKVNLKEYSEDKIDFLSNKALDLFSLLSENTAFSIKVPTSNDKGSSLVFKKEGIYRALIDEKNNKSNVNIVGEKETTGPLRILLTMIRQHMEPYITMSKENQKGVVAFDDSKTNTDFIVNYAKRLDTNFELSNVNLNNSESENTNVETSSEDTLKGGKNIIFYGAPGTGKSYGIQDYIRKHGIPDYSAEKGNKDVFRVTLHPEYTYSDFVGQLMPIVKGSDSDNREIIYDFKEGIFTLALKRANFEKDKPIFLVLEEMSRANVAAVFGDLFQLLDRKSNGEGEYAINNELLATKALGENKEYPVRLPSNLTIIGTVNTSDQNVFAMDNAFKRRFEWHYVSTEVGDNFNNNPDIEIVGVDDKVSWKNFYLSLNNYIVRNLNLNEDKQIGPYFIKFPKNSNGEFDDKTSKDLIKNKLLQYLWEDVESMVDIHSKEGIFDKSIKSFSELYSDFENDKQIFSDNFLNALKANGNNK